MSDQTPLKKSDTTSEEQVVDYLRQHPDFFTHQDALLSVLRVPHQQSGTISLVERQTALLREQNRNLKAQLDSLVEAARSSDLQFEKVRRLVINLLEAHNLEEAEVAIEEGMCQEFNGDDIQLILVGDAKHYKANNLRVINPSSGIPTKVEKLINSDWSVCGSLDDDVRSFIFPDNADKVQSAAVVPLNKGSVQGVLAIGSYQANYFHSSMGTLFLNYIGEVLSRAIYRFSTDEAKSS